MKFCSNCGSIMMPSKKDDKTLFKCSCGNEVFGEGRHAEKVEKQKEIEIHDQDAIEVLPVVKAKCPKCGHDEATNWEIQTRSPDEAATQFFKCKKCSHTWREYR